MPCRTHHLYVSLRDKQPPVYDAWFFFKRSTSPVEPTWMPENQEGQGDGEIWMWIWSMCNIRLIKSSYPSLDFGPQKVKGRDVNGHGPRPGTVKEKVDPDPSRGQLLGFGPGARTIYEAGLGLDPGLGREWYGKKF